MPIATEIVCVDCGETAYLVMPPGPEDVLQAGGVLTYRCRACGDRWDVVIDEEDLGPAE